MGEVAANLLSRIALRRCSYVGESPRVYGELWVHGEGTILIGDGVVFDAITAPIELHAHDGAVIVVGHGCHLESGTSIEATRSIRIGARCRLHEFSKVMDSHFHSPQGARHEPVDGAEVILEEDVVLGPRAIVLAGARIGRRTRVGAATVIRRRVPQDMYVQGNPPMAVPSPMRGLP